MQRQQNLPRTAVLSMSNYVRRTVLGQHPRQRLSEREVEALCSLTNARGDLIRINESYRKQLVNVSHQ